MLYEYNKHPVMLGWRDPNWKKKVPDELSEETFGGLSGAENGRGMSGKYCWGEILGGGR